MCDPVSIGAIATAAGAGTATAASIGTVAAAGAVGLGVVSTAQQYKFQKNISRYEARVAANEATQVRNRATEDELAKRRQTAQLISSQRAAAGASGIDINTGSAFQLQQDAALLGEVDALRIRNNGSRQADTIGQQSVANQISASSQRNNDLMSSGISLVQKAAKVNPKWIKPDSQGASI